MFKINGEWWMPYYRYVDMGPCSCGCYVIAGFRKIEKQEDVDGRFLKC